MDKQARLDGPAARRHVANRLGAVAPTLVERIAPALRLGRRLLPRIRLWTWRFALLPLSVTVSLLAATGAAIHWWLALSEALAIIFALAAWDTLRAYKPTARPDYAWLGVGSALALIAGLLVLPLAERAPWLVAGLALAAVALMALDVPRVIARRQIPRPVELFAWRVAAPALLGVGLIVVTTLSQGARLSIALWLVGASLSLLAFAAIRARSLAAEGKAKAGMALWRRPFVHMASALTVAGALVVWVALPRGAPHGLLLALATTPLALVALSGLGSSTFQPARAWAAQRMAALFTWAGLALTGGALASVAVAGAVDALTRALGF